MNNRWYDANPTLSMAISFLRNSTVAVQEDVSSRLYDYIKQTNPVALKRVVMSNSFPWFRNRRDFNEKTWNALESLRFIAEDERETIAMAIIQYLYSLEHGEMAEFKLGSFAPVQAAV